jgi:predicted DCC family thiol-disulfide oxidoreductase YuxK
MRKLTVLFDAGCGFCRRCRWWLERQPRYLEMEFVPAGSSEAARRFPGLEPPGDVEELVVVDDEGGVYRNGEAFVMCLYALENYREWSELLAQPSLLPLARAAFEALSDHRRRLSRWLGLETPEGVVESLSASAPVECPACRERGDG